MKRLFSFLILLSVFSVANFAQKGHNIKFKINGLSNDTCLFANYFGDKQYIADTLFIDAKGKGIVKGEKTLSGGIYMVLMPGNTSYFEVIITEQEFAIEVDTGDFINTMKISGSPENEAFNYHQKQMIRYQKEASKLNKVIDSLKKEGKPYDKEENSLNDIREESVNHNNKMREKYPNSFIVKMIDMMEEVKVPDNPNPQDSLFPYRYYSNHYFDNIDFADQRILRTPIYHNKFIRYFDKVIVHHPDTIVKGVDLFLDKAHKGDTLVFRYSIGKLLHKYEKAPYLGMDIVFVHLMKEYYLKGYCPWIDSTMEANMKERVQDLSPILPGEQAKPIFLHDTNNQIVPLYSIQSPITICYFYDPECGHCKKVTPKLRDFYHRMKDTLGIDIEVYAGTTQTDEKQWKDYIKNNNLDWINVADLHYQSYFRSYYNLKSTPKMYVLNKDKEIILNRQIDWKQLEDFILRELKMEDKIKK